MKMAQVLVREVAPDVLERLKRRARQNHRSLEAELRVILQEAADGREDQALTEVDRIRALFVGRTFSDSVELLQEDRSR
jgi:plasmid stability protein